MGNYLKWEEATPEQLKHIKMICFDIDDTVTTDGKLTAEAYSAMWELKKVGYALMPITGRSAAWCDHFARFWPVDAVVGENGAFTFFMQNGVRRRIDTLGDLATNAREKISSLKVEILKCFPHARWASDQDYREYDLAIDFCEDVAPWSSDEIARLVSLCEKLGAHAKVSSIHVNAWFGNYDKCAGIRYWFASGAPGLAGAIPSWDELIFIGDSPNDAPMFASFNHSVAVANVDKFISQMAVKPSWVTSLKSGDGFEQFAEKMVQIKKSSAMNRA